MDYLKVVGKTSDVIITFFLFTICDTFAVALIEHIRVWNALLLFQVRWYQIDFCHKNDLSYKLNTLGLLLFVFINTLFPFVVFQSNIHNSTLNTRVIRWTKFSYIFNKSLRILSGEFRWRLVWIIKALHKPNYYITKLNLPINFPF